MYTDASLLFMSRRLCIACVIHRYTLIARVVKVVIAVTTTGKYLNQNQPFMSRRNVCSA